MSRKSDKALKAAQVEVARVKASGEPRLNLGRHGNLGKAAADLEVIPDLVGMTGITALYLTGTQVSDLTPLSGLTGITWLDLAGSQVSDLTPLSGLTGLAENPGRSGLRFTDTPATRSDARLAEIAEIGNNVERALTLFDFLRSQQPPVSTSLEETAMASDVVDAEVIPAAPKMPTRRAAPLETEIRNSQLIRYVPPPPLPEGPTADRATIGWQAIQDFRKDFGRSVNLANYRSLASAVAALDRGMGTSYAELNQIAIGITGDRLALLAVDAELLARLPEGSGAELAALASAVQTFGNRFPEWLAYREDAEAERPVADAVAESLADLDLIRRVLSQGNEVVEDVAAEYADEVELARNDPTSESAARAVLASTRELLRVLGEDALMGARLYAGDGARAIRGQIAAFRRIGPDELRKKGMWGALGVTCDIYFGHGAMLLKLANTYPAQFGWLIGLLHFLAVIS